MDTKVAVLGSGTMGHGIALVCARNGHPTALYDIDMHVVEKGMARLREALDKGVERGKTKPEERARALENVWVTDDLAEAVAQADVVIEAILEDIELKRETFAAVEKGAPRGALFATNTSSLSIETIAHGLKDPARLVGLHFFNPPYVMELVEVVRGPKTSPATVDRAQAFARGLGKTTVLVSDAPGFATSRLGVALGLEAIRMLEDGVASAADIDTAMKLGYRHPMGPLELTDLVGLDVRLKIAEHLARELGPRFEPPKLLREMVKKGKLGKKAGEGFYKY